MTKRLLRAPGSTRTTCRSSVKVAFLNGTSLRPLPPAESKNEGTRYLHIHERGRIDEELVGNWIRQAGEECF